MEAFRTFELKEKRIRKCLSITKFKKPVGRTLTYQASFLEMH